MTRLLSLLSRSSVMLSLLIPGLSLAAASGLTLIESAKSGDRVAVRVLLDESVDVNTTMPDGTTALHWAVQGNHANVVALLCAAPGAAAALSLKSSSTVFGSRTPLGLAISRGRAACEAVLRAHGAPE